jgi:hypothetical protein
MFDPLYKNKGDGETLFAPEEARAAEKLKWWLIFLVREKKRMELIEQTLAQLDDGQPAEY